jgi:hypothetical protein
MESTTLDRKHLVGNPRSAELPFPIGTTLISWPGTTCVWPAATSDYCHLMPDD